MHMRDNFSYVVGERVIVMVAKFGASVYLGAPNSATNALLTSPGMQAECRRVATQLQQKVNSTVMRDSALSRGMKQRRRPVVQSLPIATAFRGTIRSGAAVKGASYGIPLSDTREALGNSVDWKN
jgi:hypothetical protein